MIKLLAAVLVVLFSSLTHANLSLPQINWKRLNQSQQIAVIGSIREHSYLLEQQNLKFSSEIKFKLIQEAYAGDYNCLVAGWPSVKDSSGSCQSPQKSNIAYDYYIGCPERALLCNPSLFGDNLCIDFESSQDKNSAFSQCEKAFAEDGRLFSEILEHVSEKEFNELISTVNNNCKTDSKSLPLCQKLKKKLQAFVEDETPENYPPLQEAIKKNQAQVIIDSAIKLQAEMESDLADFKQTCSEPITPERGIYCKNLALQIQKSKSLLDKAYSQFESKITDDCVNCSSLRTPQVIKETSVPELSGLQCTEEDKGQRSESCSQEVLCSIGSTVFSAFVTVKDIIKKKPDNCLASQNDCISNFVTAMVDSLVSLVTGIWDLLGMTIDWASDKVKDFWNHVWKVENKTADAQQMLGQMSDKEIDEVKTNPIQWIKNLSGNIWKGITQWMKQDIFCEKWSGIPRVSQCVQPMKEFECLSCRTMIAGTCSAGGVILAEIVPAFLTGGAVNLVAHAGRGADEFVKVIKASKSYQRVAKQVDSLSEVKALQVSAQMIKAPTLIVKSGLNKTAEAAIKSYRALASTSGFKLTSKALDKAAKYTGAKALIDLNEKAYLLGYSFVDKASPAAKGHATQLTMQQHIILNKVGRAQEIMEAKRAELAPLFEDTKKAYEKGKEFRDLNDELELLLKSDTPNNARITELQSKIPPVRDEISTMNDRYIRNMHEVYQKEGLPSKVTTTDEGHLILELDFTNPPKNRKAFNFYRKMKEKFGLDKVTISLKENAEYSAAGFFRSSEKRMELGPNQAASLLEEYINSTGRHESRHSMFFAKRNRGEESIFHTQYFSSSSGKLLNEEKMYERYMSAEELYTFSTDLQTLAKVFKGERVTDETIRKALVEQIKDKNSGLAVVAKTNQEMSGKMIESIESLIKNEDTVPAIRPLPNGNIEIEFADEFGRSSTMSLVSAQEKELFKDILQVAKQRNDIISNYIGNQLHLKGFDVEDLGKRAPDNLTPAEQETIQQIMEAFPHSPENLALAKGISSASIQVLEHAKKRYLDLYKLSEAQIKESEHLKKMLVAHKDGNLNEIEDIRTQMFKMGKNVKEDYKGFALK